MKRYLLIAIIFIFLAFKADNSKSTYTIPIAAWSVTAGDIDMDGDNDIIVGHNYSSLTEWSGVSYLLNDGSGTFFLTDSIFLYSWQTNIYSVDLDNDQYPEIIGRHFENDIQYMAILTYEQESYITSLYEMSFGIYGNNIGDINGDGFVDILLYSGDYNNSFWGIMYNNGLGNYSEPEYYYVTDYYPKSLACGDLNNDGRDDVVVSGQNTEVYFSYESGFELLTLEGSAGASIIDFDLDGNKDILSYSSMWGNTFLKMYKNIGNNEFETLEQFDFQSSSTKMFITDFNNDDLPDILFQLLDHTGYYIFYNQSNFQLSDSQFVALPPADPAEGWRDCYCADMDGNGYIDIITIKTSYLPLADNLEILFNDGNGNFGENPVFINERIALQQQSNLACYPNPFQYEITFEFVIDKPNQVELSIYNVQGKLIKSIRQKIREGGKKIIKWNGLNENGNNCKAGHYLANIIINGEKQQSIKFTKLN